MHLLQQPVAQPDLTLPAVPIKVDRRTLAKRLWRGAAEDGTEFGCELARPLQPGTTLFQNDTARYVVVQEPERLLEISLNMPPSAAAGLGWAIGNLHLDLMSEPSRLLTPDEKYIRQFLDRVGVPYRETTAVFRPGRFERGDTNVAASAAAQEFGPGHKH